MDWLAGAIPGCNANQAAAGHNATALGHMCNGPSRCGRGASGVGGLPGGMIGRLPLRLFLCFGLRLAGLDALFAFLQLLLLLGSGKIQGRFIAASR